MSSEYAPLSRKNEFVKNQYAKTPASRVLIVIIDNIPEFGSIKISYGRMHLYKRVKGFFKGVKWDGLLPLGLIKSLWKMHYDASRLFGVEDA